MRRDGVDDDIGADQAGAAAFESVDAAEARTEVAVAEVGVGGAAFLCRLLRGEQLKARNVGVVEEVGRGDAGFLSSVRGWEAVSRVVECGWLWQPGWEA